MNKPIVWTIAGSDSGGGAGIQADLHAFQGLGVHGCSVITALTAQNTIGVEDIHWTPANQVCAQIQALAKDLPAKAIKLGMLGNSESIVEIVEFLKTYSGAVVLDPVMIATSGANLLGSNANLYAQQLATLFSLATVITPNLHEAEKIVECKIHTYADMEKAAQKLLSFGAKSVLLKGGHFGEDLYSQDYWTNGTESFWIATTRREGQYHGTGCTLASAIAASLALGYDIKDAIVIAKMYVHRGVFEAIPVGQGQSPVAQSNWPEAAEHLPYLDFQPLQTHRTFSNCGEEPLGLYPVVDSAEWLAKLLPLGISTIQLRVKNKSGIALEKEIQDAILLSQKYSARLFVNDYWEFAIKHGAYGVHLGQEDLDTANIQKIHDAKLRLGISTHSYYELARTHAIQPSYLALGPIYPTTSKVMSFGPQGLERLSRWRKMVKCQLVAIGGIGEQQIPEVLATGVDGVAMISAITQAENFVETVRRMQENFLEVK